MKYRAWALLAIAGAFATSAAAQNAAPNLVRLTDAQREAALSQAAELRKAGRLGDFQGLLVQGVEAGSPAEAMGLRPGDVITHFAGVPVEAQNFLAARAAHAAKPEAMTVARGGQTLALQAPPGRLGIGFGPLLTLAVPGKPAAASTIHPQIGHPGAPPPAVAIAPDNRLGATAGADGAIKLWDLATGRELRSLAGHAGGVRDVKFSADGRFLLSGGRDERLRLWETATGRLVHAVAADSNNVAFLPDGRHAVAGGYKGKAFVVDLFTFETARVFQDKVNPAAPTATIESLAVSADGRLALIGGSEYANGSADVRLKVVEVASGRILRTLANGSQPSWRVALSPDGQRAASIGIDQQLRVWDTGTGAQLYTDRAAFAGADGNLAFSPDGRLLAVAGGVTRLLDAASGQEVRRFSAPVDEFKPGRDVTYQSSAVAFSPDGKQLLTGGYTTYLWDVATGARLRPLSALAAPLAGLAPGRDGKTVAAVGRGSMEVWDASSGRRLGRFTQESQFPTAVTQSPDGRFVVTGDADNNIHVIEASTGRAVRKLTGHSGSVAGLALTPDGTRLLSGGGAKLSLATLLPFASQNDGTLRLWDFATGEPLRTIKAHDSGVQAVALSPDARRAVSSSILEGMRGWDLATGALLWKQEARSAAMAVSPDGTLLLASSGTGVGLRSMADGSVVRALQGTTAGSAIGAIAGSASAVAFSADGRLAAAGVEDNTLRVWEVATGRALRTLTGHTSKPTGVRFSADGRRIFSSAEDSTLRVWDAESGRQLAMMMSFRDGHWLAITPDGYFAASSPATADKVSIVRGNEAYGVGQFYDVFYRPDIVEAALAGSDLKGLVALTIDDALRNPPPLVESVAAAAAGTAERVRIGYRLRSAGGGIGEVRVFHNGKLVSSDGVAKPLAGALAGGKVAQQTPETVAGQLRSLAGAGGAMSASAGITTPAKPDAVDAGIDIEPVPGDNEVSVIAFNAQNSIQSVVRTVSFRSERPAVAPRLYVLAIGIDQYKEKGASLKFAAKDAKDLGARWRAQAASIYGEGNIFVETLTDAQAGRAGILAKVEEMAARVRPTDHFMLFAASHGVLLGDQYYMVTSDYDGALTADKLVSSAEIVDFSKRIKALSQLYILDTCHAGGVGGLVTGLYDARVSVLARKMGLHVFASASSAEQALDGFEGNGLFTHALLAGLNNNARADRNTDRQVSLAELGAYSKDQTREIAAKLKHQQDPLIINFGQDMAVYRLK